MQTASGLRIRRGAVDAPDSFVETFARNLERGLRFPENRAHRVLGFDPGVRISI